MVTKREVIEEFNRVSTFKNILEMYEEIAASRMQNARASVLSGRSFIEELNYIFQQVKTSYRNEVLKKMHMRKIKDQKELTFIDRNGKTLFLLLSSNTGLYGDIIRKTFNLFVELMEKEKADGAIVGRVGLEYLKSSGSKIPYSYFNMPDLSINNDDLKKIIAHIIQYEKVFIVYGRFENVIAQEPIVTSISGDPLPQSESGSKVKYFFEPSLDKIMRFFEAEIFASLFEQIVFESQLAKFASRMTSLELRVENIANIFKELSLEKEKVRHRIMNKKQLETFSNMAMWK